MSVVDRSSRSDGPSGTRGSDRHHSHSDERGHRDHHRGSSRRHSPRRHESGERTRPSSSSGRSSSRSKHGVDSTALPGSTRASGKATDVRPSSSHHHHHQRSTFSSRATVDHRSLPEQHHHRQHENKAKDQTAELPTCTHFEYFVLKNGNMKFVHLIKVFVHIN